MKVVSNASPLIVLAKADLLWLLPKLFNEVCLPEGVAHEIMAGPPDDPMRQALGAQGWLLRVALEPPLSPLTTMHLGRGESEVLEYTRLHPEHVALLDDRAARRAAMGLRIKVMGTLSVIAAAAKKRHVSSFRNAAEKVRQAGLFVNQELIDAVAKETDSSPNA